MQENPHHTTPILAGKVDQRTDTVAQRLFSLLVLILIIAIVGGSLFWIQWAAQRGITLGYPIPRVKLLNAPKSPLQINSAFLFNADATGRDITYSWNFGDETNATGQQVSHSYSSNGTFTVTVTASDPMGQTSQYSTAVEVLPPLPTAQFTYSEPYGCCYIYFDASNSSADPSTSIASYSWNFGDGTSESVTYPQYQYTYSYSGTYQVTLWVVDGTGQQSQPYTMNVSV